MLIRKACLIRPYGFKNHQFLSTTKLINVVISFLSPLDGFLICCINKYVRKHLQDKYNSTYL